MPESKKRKKKRTRSFGPPTAKQEVSTTKKKKLSRQQIAIYVISILVILSMAIGFIWSGSGRTSTPVPNANNQTVLSTPLPAEATPQDTAPAQ